MDKRDVVLAALAPAKGVPHTPVQVQKLLFLIDREIPELVDGPHFNFQPYNYGPFDKDVYDVLQELASENYVYIQPEETWNSYGLTVKGQKLGDKKLRDLPKEAQRYIKAASTFVRKLTFGQLVSAIYKAYPEMRANSVFQG